MILILSKEKLEQSTEEVIDWLDYFNVKYLRINGDDFEDSGKISFNLTEHEPILIYKGKNVPLNEISAVWYRRWSDNSYKSLFFQYKDDIKFCNDLLSYQNSNNVALKTFLFSLIENKKWLTHYTNVHLNKLEVLGKAKKIGLKVPATVVCSNKSDLLNFYYKYKNIITKDLNHPLLMIKDGNRYISFTKEFSIENIKMLPSSFQPTLFQEMIKKKYEIRSFYLNGEFYSMCIFSQNDTQTEIDFRNYNFSKPNRSVPYILPEDLTQKLKQLFIQLKLDTGSIDLIKDEFGNFVFLEINSVGQFGMTSHPCNYYLEKHLAQYLINFSNE